MSVPFHRQATEVKVNEVEFNPQFVSRMIPKLEWSALVQAAEQVTVSCTRSWVYFSEPERFPSGAFSVCFSLCLYFYFF